MNKIKKDNKGFTLIEMMVVIAVIGILSAAVLGGLAPARKRARDARVISGVNQIRAIIEANVDSNDNYPKSGNFPAEALSTVKDVTNSNNEGIWYLSPAQWSRTFFLCAMLASDNTKFYCVNETGAITQDTNRASGGVKRE